MSISGLDSMALGLTVYASQGGSPLHHAKLASGCWPSSAGRGSLTRRAAMKGFCVSSHFLLSRALPDAKTPTFKSIHLWPVRSAQIQGLRSFQTHTRRLAEVSGRWVFDILTS